MSKLIVSICFCVVVLAVTASDVFACSCVPQRPVSEEFENFSTIFSGKVISVKTRRYTKRVTIKVEKSWKNSLPKTITLSTVAAGAMCGYSFTVGKRYLLYADGENSKNLSVSICSRTALLSNAKEDIEILNQLSKKRGAAKSSPK